VRNLDGDPALRSPAGLDIDGARYGVVIVRLTRTRPGGAWAGQVFYGTAAHGETPSAMIAPLDPSDPQIKETVTLVYDMAGAPSGDWSASRIGHLRFDTDDAAGGAFILRQIAVVESPGPERLAAFRR